MKEKIFNWFKKNRLYIFTFLVSLITICIVFKVEGVSPFGKKSLLCTDFFHQYGPMMGELHDRVIGGKSLSYSFSMGIGLPFFRNFFNYLSSPFNILLFLFSKESLVTIFSSIIGLKVVLSSVTMVFYLSKKLKTEAYSLIALGILYSFSAWFIAYFWNIMWLDGMVFLPLIALGIEKIVDEKKWKLYFISLFTMMFANFFIAYMLCIFSLVYFIIYITIKFLDDNRKLKNKVSTYKKTVGMFIGTSLLAALVGAFFLLPMAKSISSISATGDEFPKEQYYKFEVKDYLYSHFSGVDSTVFSSDNLNSPNVSCGTIVLFLVILFLLNKNISKKVKIGYFALLGFFALAFFLPQLDFIIHAFHVPNDLPYRYSFIYSFILIVIAGYSIVNMDKTKIAWLFGVFVFLLAVLLYINHTEWIGLTGEIIFYNIGSLIVFAFLSSICRLKKKYGMAFAVLFILLASTDAVVSIYNNWELSIDADLFYNGYEQKKEILDYIKDNDEEKFYRVETLDYMTLNDGSWYGYSGISSFSSMIHENMAILQNNLGVPGNDINSFYYTQSTPIYDLMFDVKYIFGNLNDNERYGIYQYFGTDAVSSFYHTLGPIFGVKKDVKNWIFSDPNPLEVQKGFIENATGTEQVLKRLDILDQELIAEEDGRLVVKYTVKNPKDNMYFYSDDVDVDAFVLGDTLYYNDEIYLNGDIEFENLDYAYMSDYAIDGERFIININSDEEFLEICVIYKYYNSNDLQLYTIDQANFYRAYEFLYDYRFEMQKFEEDLIKGKIDLDENMLVYTSIPYDDGWKVYIDGKKTETEALGNALLMFDCPKGEHDIKIKYVVPYSTEGFVISGCSILGIVVYELMYKKRTAR